MHFLCSPRSGFCFVVIFILLRTLLFQEAELALNAYLEAAQLGNFGAAMDLVRVRYRLNNQYDVVEVCSWVGQVPNC